MVDPLDIVNEFTTCPPGQQPYPVFDDYWLKKLCALAERCAEAENERDELCRQAKKLTG